MSAASTTELMRWASLLLIGLGLFGVAWSAMAVETSIVWRQWQRYTVGLERKLRPMFIWTPGRYIGLGQLAAIFVLLMAVVLVEVPFWPLGLVVIGIAPTLYIDYIRRERVKAVEKQLDSFLLALANALKSTPSIGAAFQSIQTIIQPPLQQEVELAVKEMKVGSTLDQALLHMAARAGSRQLDSALSSILIGRQVGGNLPRVLETTSATLREMSRLDGVIRTKTAEGKMQLYVIGFMPLILVVLFNNGFPGYLESLTGSLAGYTILLSAAGMWLAGLILARRVLSIDI